jgi:hypothetical protein
MSASEGTRFLVCVMRPNVVRDRLYKIGSQCEGGSKRRDGWRVRETYCNHLFVALLVKVLSLSAFLLLLSISKSTLAVFFPPANRSDLGAMV